MCGRGCFKYIKHSYKLENSKNIIKISLKFENQNVIINLFDNGTPIDKKNIKPRRLKDIKPGGLEPILLMKSWMK